MPYHVALELSRERVKQLKLLATKRDQSVKDLVAELVIQVLDEVAAKDSE